MTPGTAPEGAITEAELAEALDSFWLFVASGGQRVHGQVANPDEVASVLLATLSRIAAERSPAIPPAPVAASLDPQCPRCSTIAPELLMRQGEPLCPSCWDRAEAGGLDREALGRLVHEVRCAENAKLDRPFRLLSWEFRSPSQQALDIRIAEAVAAEVLTSVLRSTEKTVLTENRSEGEAR